MIAPFMLFCVLSAPTTNLFDGIPSQFPLVVWTHIETEEQLENDLSNPKEVSELCESEMENQVITAWIQ